MACQKQHGLLLQNKRKDEEDIHQLLTSSILLQAELFVRTDYLLFPLKHSSSSSSGAPSCFNISSQTYFQLVPDLRQDVSKHLLQWEHLPQVNSSTDTPGSCGGKQGKEERPVGVDDAH